MIRKILVVLILFTCSGLLAQRTSSSPYSFFGLGDIYTPRTVEQNSMGGIGVAFNHYKYLNFSNPAANAYIRQATYSFGVLNNILTVDNGGESQNSTTTSLNYIALGFPIGNKAGFTFGLQPVSSVGYSLFNNQLDNGELLAITQYNGEGGVNRIFGSFGMQVAKGFTLGVEADFSFGNIESSITNQRAGVLLATRYKESHVIRGGSLKFGTQYQKLLKDNLYLNVGTTVKLENDLTAEGNEALYSLTFGPTGIESPRDTISNVAFTGQYRFPIKSQIGLGIGKFNKWFVGAEYENQNAIKTEGFLTNTITAYRYESASKYSLGGFYLPKINSISNYWDRVTYRAGIRYEKIGLAVDGSGSLSNFTSIDDFGISFGLGLPLKQLSNVNLGLEYGKRGTTANNLIQENYFNVRISLSLNDTWFQKRKID